LRYYSSICATHTRLRCNKLFETAFYSLSVKKPLPIIFKFFYISVLFIIKLPVNKTKRNNNNKFVFLYNSLINLFLLYMILLPFVVN